MSYRHIRLTLTSKAVTHNGTRSGEEHFQDIMKYYLKQAWSRCLGRGNSSSPANQGAAKGSLGHSLNLKEIRLTVNQKNSEPGEEKHVGNTGDTASKWGPTYMCVTWQTVLDIHKSSKFQRAGGFEKWPWPNRPKKDSGYKNACGTNEEKPRPYLLV